MFWRRWRNRERDIERELRAHLELEAAEQVEKGCSPDEALSAARRQLGNITLLQEQIRGIWTTKWLDSIHQDVTYALRFFRKAPGFALIVVFALALGIAANTAAFNVLNTLLLQPPPSRDSNRAVAGLACLPPAAPVAMPPYGTKERSCFG